MECIECGETRETEFYSNNRVRCKRCCNKRTAKVYHPRRRQKQADYYQEWYKRNGRNRAIDYVNNIILWKKAHPEEIKAIRILKQAILKGEVIRPKFCSICEREGKVQGHHPDYSKPLEVLWLCASCHKKTHLGIPIRIKYRGKLGNSTTELPTNFILRR